MDDEMLRNRQSVVRRWTAATKKDGTAHRNPMHYNTLLYVALTVVTSLGCVHRPPDRSVRATVAGTVREPDAPRAVAGREVILVNVQTGRALHTQTNTSGGFTFLVRPGTCRVNVVLRDRELLSNSLPTIAVDAGDIKADADLVIAAHPR